MNTRTFHPSLGAAVILNLVLLDAAAGDGTLAQRFADPPSLPRILDTGRISAVSLGWGGYLGSAGEQVRFEVSLPQVGRIAGEQTAGI